MAQGWWKKQGRRGMWEASFNVQAYRLQVMNRFPRDWRYKQNVEHSGRLGIVRHEGALGELE